MARIPQRTLVSPRTSGAQMPQGAYTASINATASLIKAVGGVPEFFHKEAVKAQNIKNDSDKRDELRRMRTFRADFDQAILEDSALANKPEKWGPEWSQRLKGYEATLKNSDFPPVVQRYVKESFKEFAGRSAIDITGSALKENRRLAKGITLRDAQDALDADQPDKAKAIVQTGVDNNTIGPLESRDILKGIDKSVKQTDFFLSVKNDPDKHAEDAKAGVIAGHKLTPVEQIKQGEIAEREQDNQWGETLEVINQSINLPPEHPDAVTNEVELQELLDELKVKPKRQAIVMANYTSKKPLSWEEEHALRMETFGNLKDFHNGKISFKEYSKRHKKLSNKVGDYGKRQGAGAASSRLYQTRPDTLMASGGDEQKARKKARAAMEKDLEGTVSDSIRIRTAAIADASIASRQLDKDADGYAGQLAGATKTAKLYAMEVQEALETEVMDWALGQTPKPTSTEINKYVDSIQASVILRVNASRKTPLAPPKSKAERSREEYDKLRAGTQNTNGMPQRGSALGQGQVLPVKMDDTVRPDGTKKDVGFLGELKNSDGSISTEYSVGVEIDGKEVEMPTLVPTLTKAEVKHMTDVVIPSKGEVQIPQAIMLKAIAHARKRIKYGYSPFFSSKETIK